LRLLGLGFGLPAVAHDDEWYYCATAASCLERGTVKVETSAPYHPYMNPTGFTFLVALAELPVDAWFGGPAGEGTRARYRAQRGWYHLAGRSVSVLAGVLAVWATWLVGRSFLGVRAGLFAAALLALSPLHVRDSHFAVCDVAAGALMIGAVAAWRVRLDAKGAGFAGLLLGLATATKYSAGLLLPVLLLAVILTPIPGEDARSERWRRGTLLSLGAGVGFLAAFPASLLDLTAFWRSFRFQAAAGGQPYFGQDPGPSWWLHSKVLLLSLGPLGFAAAAWGWGSLARARRVALAGYPVLHLLMFLPMPLFFARIDLPLLPFLTLAAAAGLRRVRGRLAWTLVVVGLLLPPALLSARIAGVMAARETRLDLRDWLTARLPAEGEQPITLAVGAGGLRWLPTDETGSFHPRLDVIRLRVVDPTAAPEQGAAQLLELLRQRSVRWVVLTSAYSDPEPGLAALRTLLGSQASLALEVHAADEPVPVAQGERYGPWDYAWSRQRPGPSVWVYDLRPR